MRQSRICLLVFVLCLTVRNIAAQNNVTDGRTLSIGAYHYSGCYSRNNFGSFIRKAYSKVILYPQIDALEKCFSACTRYLSHFTEKNINLIAVQHRSCICISLPTHDVDTTLYRVSDAHCNETFLAGNYILGGTFVFAVYCKNDNSFLQKSTELLLKDEMLWYNELSESYTYEIVDFNFTACTTDDCITKFDRQGQLCMSRDYKTKKPNKELSNILQVLNAYVPGANYNPKLCLKYCRNPNIYKLTHEYVEFPKYAVQSVVSGYYDDIGLCHCINDLQTFHTQKFEKCGRCSSDSSQCDKNTFNKHLNLTYRIVYGTDIEKYITPMTKCIATDNFGTEWIANLRELKTAKCPITSFLNSTGWSTWQCSLQGKFVNDEPNYTNCTTTALMDMMTDFETNGKEPAEILKQLRKLVTNKNITNHAKYFGHEIKIINELAQNLSRSNTSSVILTDNERRNAVEDAIIVTGQLIANEPPWSQLDSFSRSKEATALMSSIEDILFNFAQEYSEKSVNITDTDYTIHPIDEDRDGFVVTLFAQNVTGETESSIVFPQNSDSAYIKILQNSETGRSDDVMDAPSENNYYVGILINSSYMDTLLPASKNTLPKPETNKTEVIESQIISLTALNSATGNVSSGNTATHIWLPKNEIDVEIKLSSNTHVKNRCIETTQCAYWDTKNLTWSTDGCVKISSRSTSYHTVCKCNHLTAFAVLTDVYNIIDNERGLEVLTLILCSGSIICLFATIVCIHWLNILNEERKTIITHICINLIVGNLLLVFLVDREYFCLSETYCRLVGILTHYVFLVAFGWMAVQGHYLYRMVVTVFNSGIHYMLRYTVGAYTYPIIPVSITIAIGFGVGAEPYTRDKYCWLNGDFVWAFMVPVGIILWGNCIVMVIVLRKLRRIRNKLNYQTRSSNRKSVIGSFALSFSLGITWTVGFFTLMDTEKYHFIAYVFTVLNASQGIVIFVLHCVLHEEFQSQLVKLYMSVINLCHNTRKRNSSSSTDDTGDDSSFVTIPISISKFGRRKEIKPNKGRDKKIYPFASTNEEEDNLITTDSLCSYNRIQEKENISRTAYNNNKDSLHLDESKENCNTNKSGQHTKLNGIFRSHNILFKYEETHQETIPTNRVINISRSQIISSAENKIHEKIVQSKQYVINEPTKEASKDDTNIHYCGSEILDRPKSTYLAPYTKELVTSELFLRFSER